VIGDVRAVAETADVAPDAVEHRPHGHCVEVVQAEGTIGVVGIGLKVLEVGMTA